jgi:hypothetical protein
MIVIKFSVQIIDTFNHWFSSKICNSNKKNLVTFNKKTRFDCFHFLSNISMQIFKANIICFKKYIGGERRASLKKTH